MPIIIAGHSPANGIRASKLSRNLLGSPSKRLTQSCLLFESLESHESLVMIRSTKVRTKGCGLVGISIRAGLV